MKDVDMSGMDMVRDHKNDYIHVKRVGIYQKRKNRDRKFAKVEFALFTIAAILLLNEDISWKQMAISAGFAVAGLITDFIRRHV